MRVLVLSQVESGLITKNIQPHQIASIARKILQSEFQLNLSFAMSLLEFSVCCLGGWRYVWQNPKNFCCSGTYNIVYETMVRVGHIPKLFNFCSWVKRSQAVQKSLFHQGFLLIESRCKNSLSGLKQIYITLLFWLFLIVTNWSSINLMKMFNRRSIQSWREGRQTLYIIILGNQEKAN